MIKKYLITSVASITFPHSSLPSRTLPRHTLTPNPHSTTRRRDASFPGRDAFRLRYRACQLRREANQPGNLTNQHGSYHNQLGSMT